MRRIIIEKGVKYHTYLKNLFAAMENEQLNYNWLITDCVCYPESKVYDELFQRDYLWLSGRELTNIFMEEDFQMIWGMFSAFKPNLTLDEVLKYKLPQNQDNDRSRDLYDPQVLPKHPLAEVEIQAVDSSFTMIISKNDGLVQHVTKAFPQYQEFSDFFKK